MTKYSRRRDGGLERNDTIALPHAPDNVQALENGGLLIGSLPRLHECAGPGNAGALGALTLATPGPAPPRADRARGARGFGDERWWFRDVVRADWEQVSGGIVAGGRALVGSPYARGALLCDLPPDVADAVGAVL